MIQTQNIHSLSDFQRNTTQHLKKMRDSGLPEILTINGKAEIIVQSADAYQALLNKLDLYESARAIDKGMQQFRAGNFLTLEEFDHEMDTVIANTEPKD